MGTILLLHLLKLVEERKCCSSRAKQRSKFQNLDSRVNKRCFLDSIKLQLIFFFSFGIFWCLLVEHRIPYLIADHKKSYAHTVKIRCRSQNWKLAERFSIWYFEKMPNFMASLGSSVDIPICHVKARPLKSFKHRSSCTSFDSLYNVESKNKKRLHIIFRSLWSTDSFVPSFKVCWKSWNWSRIGFSFTKLIFNSCWSDQRVGEIDLYIKGIER